jgi:hypothetical protein
VVVPDNVQAGLQAADNCLLNSEQLFLTRVDQGKGDPLQWFLGHETVEAVVRLNLMVE